MPARPLLLPVARNSRPVCQLRYYNACYLIASEYTVLLGIVENTRLKLKRNSAVSWDAGTRPEARLICQNPGFYSFSVACAQLKMKASEAAGWRVWKQKVPQGSSRAVQFVETTSV